MKQYCRYCAFCIDGDWFYCTDMGKLLTENDIKRANKCPSFAMSALGDVVTGKKYQERPAKHEDGEQINIFDEIEGLTLAQKMSEREREETTP